MLVLKVGWSSIFLQCNLVVTCLLITVSLVIEKCLAICFQSQALSVVEAAVGLFRWCNAIDAAGGKCSMLTSDTWPLGKIGKCVSNLRAKSMAEPKAGIFSLCSR